MKTNLKTLQNSSIVFAFLLVSAFFSAAAHGQILGFDVDFNSGNSTYADNFRAGSDVAVTTANTGLTWNATVGTGGSGGLSVTNTTTANIYYRPSPAGDTTSTFDFANLSAGATFTSTSDFLWSNSTATTLTVLTAGFTLTNNSTTEVSGGNALAGSIIRSGNSTVTLRMRNAGANANTLAFDQSTLTAGEWYRLSYQLTKAATINEFGYTVSLFSIGADGASAPVLFFDGTKSITITGTVTNSSFYGDSNAFFGYDIRNTNGISQVDNFVVVVPEPASASLMIIGLVMLALFLRQRGTVRTAYFHISTKQKRYGLSGEQARVGTSAPSMAIHI